jgi:hypothetical protein
VRAVAAVCWIALGEYGAFLATAGLGASFYIEPTSDALAAERHGQAVVAWTCLLFLVLAAVARLVFDAPWWSPGLMGMLAVTLLIVSSTSWAFLAIPLPYVVVLAAAVGVVCGPGPWRSRTDVASRD